MGRKGGPEKDPNVHFAFLYFPGAFLCVKKKEKGG